MNEIYVIIYMISYLLIYLTFFDEIGPRNIPKK